MTVYVAERDNCDIREEQENQTYRLTMFALASLGVATGGEFWHQADIKHAGLAASIVALGGIAHKVFKYDL